jgi:hypothetical protein
VVSVTMQATVNQWIESDDEDDQTAFYWRQAFDVRNSQLSVGQGMRPCKSEIQANILSSLWN